MSQASIGAAPPAAPDSPSPGWASATLADVCSLISDGTHQTPRYVPAGVPFYSVENVTADNFSDTKFVSEHEHRAMSATRSLQKGDLLMTRIGSLGKTKLIDWDVRASFYVSLAVLRPNRAIDARYLYAYTQSSKFIRAVEERSLLWAAPKKINMGDIGKVPIFYPRDQQEQIRIADAIIDSESLIRSLERLISKKREIKQGVMQQLLGGGVRLSGFTGGWQDTRLGKVADIKTGSRNNQDKKSDGLYPFFVRSATVERIDTYSYDCEAILVPGEGGIGTIFHYINGKFDVHQRVYRISDFSPTTHGKFIYFYMRQYFGPHAMENSVKATVDSLRLPTFVNFKMTIPSDVREQQAIAEVLEDVEEEIAVLETRLRKARFIKQGVMQKLLSGHILEEVS